MGNEMMLEKSGSGSWSGLAGLIPARLEGAGPAYAVVLAVDAAAVVVAAVVVVVVDAVAEVVEQELGGDT